MNGRAYTEKPFPPSLWKASDLGISDVDPLEEDIQADIVIIGAGIAGLSTALHLAEEGVKCTVIEAFQPGWGASGRNGGQVIPGLKYDPDEIEKKMGKNAEAVIDMAGHSANYVFELIKKYNIDCYPEQKGWIQTAHNERVLKIIEKRVSQWQQRGAKVELLDKSQVTDRIGTKGFIGGLIDYRAGSIHPLRYTQGLLKTCQDLGVKVYGFTKAVKLNRKADGWVVQTHNGSCIAAKKVVITTNAYSDSLWPDLQKTFIPANSFVIATKPLSSQLQNSILKYGQVSSDSRRLLVYFRKDNQGRFILGGRGSLHEPHSFSQWSSVYTAMVNLFPQLEGVEIDYKWAGRIAVTHDFLVHVHEPAPDIHILLGFSGRGLALATIMGAKQAKRIISGDVNDFPYPVTKISPIPLHGLNKFYMAMGVTWYKMLDKFI